MSSLVMSLFSCDYIKTEIDYIKYQQCFNLLARVQYLHSAWFLDGRTSILVPISNKTLVVFIRNFTATHAIIYTNLQRRNKY